MPTEARNWPRAYWINLDGNVARRRRMEERFAAAGWHDAVRVRGVNGRDPDEVGRHIVSRARSPAEAACIAAHLLALRAALDNGEETALILEDDAWFVPPWQRTPPPFSAAVPEPPRDWGIVQLCVQQDPPRLDWLFRQPQAYVPVGRRCWWSLAAYLVRRPAMEALLARYGSGGRFDVTGFDGPHEAYMVVMHGLPAGPGVYVARVPVFTTDEADSDLHPDHLQRHRRACRFLEDQLPQLQAGSYRSPFPFWRRRLEDWRIAREPA